MDTRQSELATLARILNTIETEVVRARVVEVATPTLPDPVADNVRSTVLAMLAESETDPEHTPPLSVLPRLFRCGNCSRRSAPVTR